MKKRVVLFSIVTLMGCREVGAADTKHGVAARAIAPAVESEKPSESAARFQKSYDAEAAGNTEEALSAIDALSVTGDAAYVLQLRRGWLLYRLGRHADAVSAYEKAIAAAGDSVEAKVGILAPLAALRRWIDVEREAREVLAKDTMNYSATIRLAYALYSQAKFVDSAATYRRLLASYPSDVEVRSGLGWALLKAGRNDQAGEVFRQVLDIAPRNALAQDGVRAAKQLPK